MKTLHSIPKEISKFPLTEFQELTIKGLSIAYPIYTVYGITPSGDLYVWDHPESQEDRFWTTLGRETNYWYRQGMLLHRNSPLPEVTVLALPENFDRQTDYTNA